MELLRRLDAVDQPARISGPTLVCVGQVDPVVPVAAASEIVNALAPGIGQLDVIDRAGHFPWLDRPIATGQSSPTFVMSATPRRDNTETPMLHQTA